MRKQHILPFLETAQSVLSSFPTPYRLTYRPRECNVLADYIAGEASKYALTKELVEHTKVLTSFPVSLLQQQGFTLAFTHQHHHSATERTTGTNDLAFKLLRQFPRYREYFAQYAAVTTRFTKPLTVHYRPTAYDCLGRIYAQRPSAVTLPKKLRVALFGLTHVELDMTGAHYELVRRLTPLSVPLPHILDLRNMVNDLLCPYLIAPATQKVLKNWPASVLNSRSIQDSNQGLERFLSCSVPPQLTTIAKHIIVARDALLNSLPSWAPSRTEHWPTGGVFRQLENLEATIMRSTLQFIQSRQIIESLILLHDGIWFSPGPDAKLVPDLHQFLEHKFQFNVTDPPLFRFKTLSDTFYELDATHKEVIPLKSPGIYKQYVIPQTLSGHIFTKARKRLRNFAAQSERQFQRLAKRSKK
eukprot:Skav206962  [mRNA]  locus=scaffold255:267774:269018:+ [translate_table: standard]